MKRRMSYRFMVPGEVGEIPAMPTMPDLAQLPGSAARKALVATKEGGFQGLDLDLDAFREPGFNPDLCTWASIY